ncbi:protoheme IX farnesyltransferase [bacterium]|nr:protoheme IX farnesyltransferase [bacterium]
MAMIRNRRLRPGLLLFIIASDMRRIISPFIELIKPRIAFMQAVTVAMGFFLARAQFPTSGRLLIPLLIGTVLTASGAAALNHFLERNIDGLMDRTKNRPIPSGVIPPWQAAVLGFGLLGIGLAILWIWTNSWVTFLSFLTAFLYVIFYTPLKQMTWLNTYIGAIPGAIPPMAGWGAVTGHLGAGAWELFLILFFWQMPHFFAIAWMYRNDYQKAGFKMLPGEDESGDRTYFHMMVNALLLVAVSVLPWTLGHLGVIYTVSAAVLGAWLLRVIFKFRHLRDRDTALKIMKVSVFYLPLLLLAILADVLI